MDTFTYQQDGEQFIVFLTAGDGVPQQYCVTTTRARAQYLVATLNAAAALAARAPRGPKLSDLLRIGR